MRRPDRPNDDEIALLCRGRAARRRRAGLSAAEPAKAKPASLPPAPTINIDVTQWVVFVADPSYPELNRRGAVANDLPPLIGDLRTTRAAIDDASQARPGPVGVIRIIRSGLVNKDETFDVKLGYQNGHVLGQWPTARSHSSSLLWQDLHVAGDQPAARPLPEGSWLNPLRAGGTLFTAGPTAESFLLFDLELSHPVAHRSERLGNGRLPLGPRHGQPAARSDALQAGRRWALANGHGGEPRAFAPT